jgi:1,4-alpha-glucan branching enzyme
VPRYGYRIGVPLPGFYEEAINTDAEVYGGGNVGNMGGLRAEEAPCHGHPYSLVLTLPPLGTVYMVRREG